MLHLEWFGKGEDEVCGKNQLSTKRVELAGRAHHARCLNAAGVSQSDTSDTDSVKTEDLDDDARMRADWEAKHGKHEDMDEDDLYSILDISHLGFSASQPQIKKAYQRAVLIHHPDKKGGVEDEAFLKVQKAWEVLGNAAKRRGYDSQFAFDDSIPGNVLATGADFYATFEPVFTRNARFSVRKPVPHLGDAKTGAEKVKKFYNFWLGFESWREFSKFDEFHDGDIENAGSRIERRWMTRQNEIQRNKRKKKEIARVQDLVQRAKSLDPRVAHYTATEKAEKEALQQAKVDKKLALEQEKLEKETREQDQADRILREEKEIALKKKQERQKTIKAYKEAKATLENLADQIKDIMLCGKVHGALYNITEHHKLDAEALQPFIVMLEAGDFDELFLGEQKIADDKEAALNPGAPKIHRAVAQVVETEPVSSKPEATPWSHAEISYLSKAVKKFPGGSRNRWMIISQYMNGMTGATVERSPEECIAQSKVKITINAEAAFEDFKATVAAPAPEEEGDVWTSEQQTALEQALKKYPGSMEKNARWKAVAKDVPDKNKKECVDRFKFLRQTLMQQKEQA